MRVEHRRVDDRRDVLRGEQALVVVEHLEALLGDLRRRRVPDHGVDFLGGERFAEQRAELDRDVVGELDAVDLRILQPDQALRALRALCGCADDVAETGEIGDRRRFGVAADDERIAVDGG